ncbi:unnamed protein product, partial [Mesorhabditis belari]|uniref:Lipase n=1 Tax=Mesorhabditis belari TaxID=2138241 RepID=A0AAF3EXN3_9BILA
MRLCRIPVVFIHGLGTKAGDYVSIQKIFKEAGYKLEEIYALTWGTPGSFFTGVHLECKHVLQIRRFLEAVSDFTNSKVDIIAYSMGSPLTRKAILGGPCVDNPEIDLGPPISDRIQTFLAVGGANSGSHLCQTPTTLFCNAVTGLHCNSTFMQDINSRRNYEAAEVFAIYNPQDEWIGDKSPCGTPPYTLPGADFHLFPQTFHVSILWRSAREQLALITRKYEMGNLLQDIKKLRMRLIPSAISGNHVQDNTVDDREFLEELRRRRRRLQDRTTRIHRTTESTRIAGEVAHPTSTISSSSPARTVRLVALQDDPLPLNPPSISSKSVILLAIQSPQTRNRRTFGAKTFTTKV